jgi:hypothetical protein
MPDKNLSLIFGSFNSIPPGISPKELEESYQNYYKPFLSAFYHQESLPLVCYFNGPLFAWLCDTHPEYLMLINEMIKRKQLELLTGAYFDPFLPLASSIDRLGQIEMLTTLVRKKCGKRPRGIWLPALVWEPDLTSVLNSAGLKYTFLHEDNFHSAGLSGNDVFRAWLTEDQGKVLEILPVTDSHASLMLNSRPDHFVHELKSRIGSGICPVFFERKHFLSRNINDQASVRKILDDCLKAAATDPSVKAFLPGRYLKDCKSWKKIYLPPTILSSETFPVPAIELQQTKRKKNYTPEKIRQRSFFFRQWLEEIPESSLLYAKSQHVGLLIGQFSADRARKKAAKEELWAAQNHHAYWPEADGGIWDNTIRNEAYSHLIEAEKLSRQKGVFIPSIIMSDYDFDGEKEYLYQGDFYNAYVCSEGGLVFEYDFLNRSHNLAGCVGADSAGLGSLIENAQTPVAYMKKLFCDHFWKKADDAENFFQRSYASWSGADKKYELEEFDRDKLAVSLRLKKIPLGKLDKPSGLLKKRFVFSPEALNIEYTLTSDDRQLTEVFFGTEMNFSLKAGLSSLSLHAEDEKGRKINAKFGEPIKSLSKLQITDPVAGLKIHLSFDKKPFVIATQNHLCVQTALGLKDYEQGVSVLFFWKAALNKDKSFCVNVNYSVDSVGDKEEILE